MSIELHLLRPWWLLALPPMAWIWWWLGRQRPDARRWESLVDAQLRGHVLLPAPSPRRSARWWLLGATWLALIVALAGPAWQREARPVFRLERAHVLILDLSASMDRADVPPSRLGRARFELLDLLAALREGSTALIVYGAEPFLVAPLTRDAATIAAQVPVLATDLLPVAGPERLELALDMAGALLARAGAPAGEVVLISDGTDGGEPARRAAARLHAAGHRLSVLAVTAGTWSGGASDDADLEAIAAAGGGPLVTARADDGDLDRLLPWRAPRAGERSRDPVVRSEHWRDDGPWLLLVLLPIAALAFRRGWLGLLPLALLLMPPPAAVAFDWGDLWLRGDQQALQALEDGDAAAAGERFQDPRWRAAALYRAGEYQKALTQLTGQVDVEAHYNRGNILARLGRFEDAIGAYEAALKLVPDHADARHNRDLLRALLAAPLAEQAQAANGSAANGWSPQRGSAAGADGVSVPSEGADAVLGPGTAGGDAAATAAGAPEASHPPRSVKGDTGLADGRGEDAGAAEPDGSAGKSRNDTAALAEQREQVRPGAASGADAGSRQVSGVAAARTDAGGAGAAASAVGDGPGTTDALLRQVPDDPAGLLRERFMLQYLRRHGRLY